MPHYVAFLRGINLGNRRITMDRLRARFEDLGFADVATFIASGNVLFASRNSNPHTLEQKIEQHLRQSLDYEVDTFIRTRAEVSAVSTFQPFAEADLTHPAHTVHAGFLRQAPTTAIASGLPACRTDVDAFCVHGREYYWLCRIKSHESKVWASPALKVLKLPSSTMRNLTTIRKLAALYPEPA